MQGWLILQVKKKLQEFMEDVKDSLYHGQGSCTTIQGGLILSTEKKLREIMEEVLLKDGDTQFKPLSAIQGKCEETVAMQNLFSVAPRRWPITSGSHS